MTTERPLASPSGARPALWMAVPVLAALLAFISTQSHAASFWPLFLFHLSFVTLVALALPAPRSHAYSAFAAVLLLGYWPKFLLRLVAPSPYLEPTGAFDGTTESWNTALVVIATGIAGVVVARLVQLWFGGERSDLPMTAPGLYRRWKRFIWGLSAATILAGYAWNVHAAVYATGINPRVVLPFGLNIILAWCYIMAFPLWLAVLIGWELADRRTGRLGWDLLWIPLAEGILNAGSVLSRATYLLRIAPYFLARSRPQIPALQLPRPGWLTVPIVGLGFALSVVVVMALRTVIYFGPAPAAATTATAAASVPATSAATPAAPVTGRPAPSVSTDGAAQVAAPPAPLRALLARRLAYIIREVNSLFLDRWTGMEGVLAVTSSPRSFGALMAVVREDPSAGNDAIYQRVARSSYVAQARFTFLTLAGIIGVLATSGSLLFVLGGMALVSVMLMAAEVALRAVTRNEIACSVVAVTAAFVTAQVTFPRLYGVFVLELWTTLSALAALIWLLGRLDDTSQSRHLT
jgi:hypothetical protein